MKDKSGYGCSKRFLFLGLILFFITVVTISFSKYLFVDNTVGTSFKVYNVDDAICQLKNLSNEYGYENALSELTEKSTNAIDGDIYYRLQQNYQGIPVYGRTVVCATNENGDVISVTGNVDDVDPSVSIIPAISFADASVSAKQYMSNKMNIDDLEKFSVYEGNHNDLCILNSEENENTHLAFRVSVTCYIDTINQYELLVNAQTGDVLLAYATLRDDSATGYRSSDINRQNGFTVERLSDGRYALINGKLGLVVYDLKRVNSSKKIVGGSSYVVSDNNIFGDDIKIECTQEAGADMLVNVSNIHEYYNSLVGFETKSGLIALYYNDSYNFGRNARGGISGDNGLLIVGHATGTNDIDVLAHEYGHIMSFTTIGWNSNEVETQAINEGLSDIFGEIAEAYVSGWSAPDWIMTGENINMVRNIQDPESGGFADNIGDTSIWNEYIKGEEYFYSTTISHAAYLMWNGIDGDESKKININDLAKLWYRAMLMMPSDCDFTTCRQMVEWAALAVGLTDTQRDSIAEAFDAVGIYNTRLLPEMLTDCDQNVVSDAVLNVYNVDGKLHSRYTLEINGTIAEHELSYFTNIVSDTGYLYETTKSITSAKSYHLNLPDGYYTFKITDKNTPQFEYTFTVSVSNQGKEIIELYTDFKEQLLVNITDSLSEERASSDAKSSVYETVESRTGLHCEWAVSGDFDNDGRGEIYAFVCTSATDYTNGQIWYFATSKDRCLFYFEVVESELFCYMAKSIPDWLVVELIKAVDNIDEFISDIERRYF